MKRVALALALAAAAAACGDNGGGNGGNDGGNDGPPDPPPATLTTFVTDLVLNQTSGTAQPVAFDQFATLPDPDGDGNNLAAYAALFQ